MLHENTNLKSIFEGDEIKTLENVINKMNSVNQNNGKSLDIIWLDRNLNMKSTINMTQTLLVDIDKMNVVSAELNGKKLNMPLWSILHEVYFWYMDEKITMTQYVDEVTTKDLYLRLFVNAFETQQIKVKTAVNNEVQDKNSLLVLKMQDFDVSQCQRLN